MLCLLLLSSYIIYITNQPYAYWLFSQLSKNTSLTVSVSCLFSRCSIDFPVWVESCIWKWFFLRCWAIQQAFHRSLWFCVFWSVVRWQDGDVISGDRRFWYNAHPRWIFLEVGSIGLVLHQPVGVFAGPPGEIWFVSVSCPVLLCSYDRRIVILIYH